VRYFKNVASDRQWGSMKLKAKVTVLNISFQLARAQTENDLAFSFRMPRDAELTMSDEIEVDLEQLGREQDAVNHSKGKRFKLKIEPFNVQDLKHPHTRFVPPNLARRRGSERPQV
jgi:hypothetical protein